MVEKLLLLIFSMLCINNSSIKAQGHNWFNNISFEGIDSLQFGDNYTLDEYFKITQIAIVGMSDSLNDSISLKGGVLLDKIADEISKAITEERMNPRDRDVKKLLKTFEANQHFIYQPKIHDFIKLAHYSCVGMYGHIYNRFVDSIFIYPVIFLFSGFVFLFVGINGFWRSWKFRRTLNRIAIIGIVGVFILCILFKLTCHDCVKEDYFYGIPF